MTAQHFVKTTLIQMQFFFNLLTAFSQCLCFSFENKIKTWGSFALSSKRKKYVQNQNFNFCLRLVSFAGFKNSYFYKILFACWKMLYYKAGHQAGTVAEWYRALVQNPSEWTVPSSNPSESCYGDGELSGSRIALFPHMAINNHEPSSINTLLYIDSSLSVPVVALS